MSTEPTINWPFIYTLLFAVQWIINIGVAAWLYLRKADGSNEKAIDSLKNQMGRFMEQQNERMTRLEADVKHLPTDAEFSAIREDVATTKARTEGMAEALRRVEHQTNLIHEHLLRRV